jgi:hypothetical protein
MPNYYIDGTNLNNAVAVYSDPALTQCAPAGFYSDGVIAREQVLAGSVCNLLPPQACPSCATPCGDSIAASTSDAGVYYLDMDLGGTTTDTGAIVVLFDPRSFPDGIEATYDGVVYNTLSSPVYGLLQGTAGLPTYVGSTAGDCGISGSTYNLAVNQYVGTGFQPTGNTESVFVNPGSVQVTAQLPGDNIMVIPKPNQSPTTINFKFIGPCGGTVFDLAVDCPAAIPSMISSGPKNTSALACAALLDNVLYHVPVVNRTVQNVIEINDYVFVDENGATPANLGWYQHSSGYVFEVGPSGVVIAKQTNCGTITVDDCNGGGLYTMNDRFGTNVTGEVIEYKRINQVTGVLESGIYCGTIQSTGTGVTTNAMQYNFLDRDCGDTTHCP